MSQTCKAKNLLLLVRRPKKYINPSPQAFSVKGPEALQRPPSTNAQKNFAEDTILYGENDALPLKIAQTVAKSPSTTACLETVAKFIKGSKFSDPDMMKLKVNKTGQTLWDLHSELCDSLALFWGYSLNLKFNENLNITHMYSMPFEMMRLVKPEADQSHKISFVKYNPFFGTGEYQKKFTQTYPVWDGNKEELQRQVKDRKYTGEDGKSIYPGQVFYYGKTSSLYRYYPVPKYWSAENWIKVDADIQEFHAENIDNGFFQSLLLNMIGDPSKKSTNPEYQRKVTGTDGVVRTESTKTVGEEFNDLMSRAFSGKKKAGTVMTMWSQNHDNAAKVVPFPNNTNADLFQGTLTDALRGITIATGVPAILANLPQQESSLGSDGKSMQVAIELMHSRVVEWQNNLMQLYNEVIIPNFAVDNVLIANRKVEIVNYSPITVPIEIEDKFWNVLNDQEKRNFIKKNFPSVELMEVATTQTGEPVQPNVNENIKNMTGRQLQNIQRIVRKYNKGEITHAIALQNLITGFGMTAQEAETWLIEDDDATTTLQLSK